MCATHMSGMLGTLLVHSGRLRYRFQLCKQVMEYSSSVSFGVVTEDESFETPHEFTIGVLAQGKCWPAGYLQ